MSRRVSFVEHAERYLAERRAMGFGLRIAGGRLLAFARFADVEAPRGHLTTALAVAWARTTRAKSTVARARRLEIVRPFARYLLRVDPRTQVPPRRLLGPAHRRLAPHLFTAPEICAMIDQAEKLAPSGGLRPAAVSTLIGLLACTGLRVSEALRLQRRDVDLRAAVLDVRETKFKKRRWVPLHPTAVKSLEAYEDRRDRSERKPQSDAFFLVDGGRALTYSRLRTAFRRVRIGLGWARLPLVRRKLQSLRHTFACARLVRWHAEGDSVDRRLLDLSTYLGHAKVTDTYWYLSAFPELLEISGRRFRRFAASKAVSS